MVAFYFMYSKFWTMDFYPLRLNLFLLFPTSKCSIIHCYSARAFFSLYEKYWWLEWPWVLTLVITFYFPLCSHPSGQPCKEKKTFYYKITIYITQHCVIYCIRLRTCMKNRMCNQWDNWRANGPEVLLYNQLITDPTYNKTCWTDV